MPHFTFTGWDGVGNAAETAVPNLIPAAGLTIPAGSRAVIRRMSGFNNKAAIVTFWLTRNALVVTPANHIASITVPINDGVDVNTYVYIDAIAAAIPVLLSYMGAGAAVATFSCSGYWE
jgi:hypothetical protein